MKKIKILHIIKSLGRGGAEVLLPETLKIHSGDKFEFHYIYFLPWKDQVVSEIKNLGGVVTCLPASNNFTLLFNYYKVIKYCINNQIDLIHCHLPWSGFLGRIVHKKIKIPVIYTEHNIQERYHTLTSILNRQSFNYQSLAIGVSKDVTRSINENINPKIPVKTILNGVNTKKFTRDTKTGKWIKEKYNIPKDAVVIGNIAVFRDQKNLPDWIKAFKKINNSNHNVYGLLVGSGLRDEEIKALISELGLQDRIILPGLQTDTVKYFSAMDIFMMSSAFEGLPIALLEAMSMNCAVVSTKAGGVVEVIRDGVDGLLSEVGDWENLANNTLSLVSDKTRRATLQIAARERVLNSFSLSMMVENLERLYEKVGGTFSR